MSIYATALVLASGLRSDGPAPIQYQGSHVLPEDSLPRLGGVLLCEIPGFVEREGRPARSPENGTQVWPWLRLSAQSDEQTPPVIVLLDQSQVRQIRDYLTEWLERAG